MEKTSGLATQLRELRKRFEALDTAKEDPAKVRELRDLIKDMEEDLASKKQQKEERAKAREEAAKAAPAPVEAKPAEEVEKEAKPEVAPPVENITPPAEVPQEIKPEPVPAPVEDVFSIDDKVSPVRGEPGSVGVVIRAPNVNGDPLCYIKWTEGPLSKKHEYAGHYSADLKKYSEPTPEPTLAPAQDTVPKESFQKLESDLKGNYEAMIRDLQEEIETAKSKGEMAWVSRLEEKLAGIQKTYKERFEIKAEENGSGGTEKLTVKDWTDAHDKDPQEKSTGYGGDRSMGAMTVPHRDDMDSLGLDSSLHKQAITLTISGKTFDIESITKEGKIDGYDVSTSGSKLFRINTHSELGEPHLSYIISTELEKKNKTAEQKFKCEGCGSQLEGDSGDICSECLKKHLQKKSPKVARLTANVAFLKKGTLVNVFETDKKKGQIKFASLDKKLHGWANVKKFALMPEEGFEPKYMDHDGHKDEILAETPTEICVTCPTTRNIEWRKPEAPTATPESIVEPEVVASEKGGKPSALDFKERKEELKREDSELPPEHICKQCKQPMGYQGFLGDVCGKCVRKNHQNVVGKNAAGCDQCAATMINGVFCHETGCPNNRRPINCDVCGYPVEPDAPEDHQHDNIEASLNIEARVVEKSDGWHVLSEEGKNLGGPYKEKSQAVKRLRQVEYFKSHKSSLELQASEGNCQKCRAWKKDIQVYVVPGQGDMKLCAGCKDVLAREQLRQDHPGMGFAALSKKEINKKAEPVLPDVSIETQVQGFRDRMQSVRDSLSNPPTKTAEQEAKPTPTAEVIEMIEKGIDLLETVGGDELSPENKATLEKMENDLWSVEDSLGLAHPLPPHEDEKIHEPFIKERGIEPEVPAKVEEPTEPPVEKESSAEECYCATDCTHSKGSYARTQGWTSHNVCGDCGKRCDKYNISKGDVATKESSVEVKADIPPMPTTPLSPDEEWILDTRVPPGTWVKQVKKV